MAEQKKRMRYDGFDSSTDLRRDSASDSATLGSRRWYFDALSDDSDEALIISFSDSNLFGLSGTPSAEFLYYRDGRIIYQSATTGDFIDLKENGADAQQYSVGECSFQFNSTPYGSGYSVLFGAHLGGGKTLDAKLEWLSIEQGVTPKFRLNNEANIEWNPASPRADVTGKITIKKRKGRGFEEINFRGTGFHDFISHEGYSTIPIACIQRGSVHFPNSTAIFQSRKPRDNTHFDSTLLIIRDGKLLELEPDIIVTESARSRFGTKYPSKFSLLENGETRLIVEHRELLESSICRLRHLSEITVFLEDKKERVGLGLTESLLPNALGFRILNRLANARLF